MKINDNMTLFNKKFKIVKEEKEKLEQLIFTLKMLSCGIEDIHNQHEWESQLTITIVQSYSGKRANLQLFFDDHFLINNVGVHSKDFEDRWKSNINEAYDILIEYF